MKKSIVLTLLVIGLGYPVVATAKKSVSPAYLKNVIDKKSRLMSTVNMTHLRQLLRPEVEAPTMQEYLAQHLGSADQSQMTPQQQADYGQKVKVLLEEWADQYYPELSEKEVIEVLSKDEKLRAKTVALTLSGVNNLVQSAGLMTLIMAIDADVEDTELQTRINQLNQPIMQTIYSDGEPRFGIGRQTYIYGNNQVYPVTYDSGLTYINRTSRLRHMPLQTNELNVLRMLGYTDSELIDKISPALAQLLVNDQVRPELDDSLINLPASVTIDLLTEPGIIGDYVLTPYQLESSDEPLEYLARELEIDADSLEHLDAKLAMSEDNWLQRVVELLDDPDSPATLFQVTQLRRLGFSFDEINALSYLAREAIIVSGYENREIFVEQHGDLSKVNAFVKINGFVKKTGPFVYRMLRLGYELDQINEHPLIDPAEVDSDLRKMQFWQIVLSSKTEDSPSPE